MYFSWYLHNVLSWFESKFPEIEAGQICRIEIRNKQNELWFNTEQYDIIVCLYKIRTIYVGHTNTLTHVSSWWIGIWKIYICLWNCSSVRVPLLKPNFHNDKCYHKCLNQTNPIVIIHSVRYVMRDFSKMSTRYIWLELLCTQNQTHYQLFEHEFMRK